MSCVPCPCDALGVTGRIQCPILTNLMADPPRLGQLYATAITTIDNLPIIFNGVEDNLQAAVTPWFLKIGIALSLPWIIIAFITLYILYRNSIINYDLFVVAILCMLFVVGCALVYLYNVVYTVVSQAINKITEPIVDNWNEHKADIVPDIISSYIGCVYCESSTFGCTNNCGGLCNGACQ